MSEQDFTIVRKGYDPTEVADAIAALQSTVRRLKNRLTAANESAAAATAKSEEHSATIADLNEKITAAQEELEGVITGEGANFSHLGQRISTMLGLAKEEADELRGTAQERADALAAEITADAIAFRDQAEQQAADSISKAEAEAAHIAEVAMQRADRIKADTDEEIARRKAHAEELLEQQKTAAAAAAVDFEQTLAARRKEALASLESDVAARNEEVSEANNQLIEIRSEARRTEFEARERAEQIVRAAEERSDELMTAAQERADALRDQAQRELDAALARRDSINEQLASVRQMLTAYGAPGPDGDATTLAELVDISVEDPSDPTASEETPSA